ncbi:MAG: hypothetical protein M3P30_03615 [Chloroflexota bacterium]|nr:hypothetical protein [Chloroflexota bacterium]
MPNTVAGQLLAAIRSRKFSTASRLFATPVDFEAWTPSGHWVATDVATISKIIEVWFTPGAASTVTYSNETSGPRGAQILEHEIQWKIQPDDQIRVLRQVYLLTVKGEKIISARVYCAGLHTEFPEVDLEKQRRSKGLTAAKPPSPKAIIAKAS